MRKRAPVLVLFASLAAMVTGTAAYAQFGGTIGSIIKVAGIGYAVKVFGGQINSFLNTVLQEHNVGGLPATKVVPIIRLGSTTAVGAVQVAGRPDVVSRVQAAVEGDLVVGRAQLRYLLPVNSLSLSKLPGRVSGVGVSAIIDFPV
ncbi:MAG TPA: hypothetical protein VFJ58_14745 [Armatimonadota bacterium]|nr:hypothetical protein [Armatimonadota bacterium]